MKFTLAMNMERLSPATDMRDVIRHGLEMVQMADEGGFDIAWAAEHHSIETVISPDPFQLLAFWGENTSRIRLGTAVVVAPYWHPIKLAGEAAMADLLSGGRLELGLGRGAYQREFDRMAGGIPQQQGIAYMQEMLPVLKALWAGDYEHRGTHWSFPVSTSVPKPLQKPHPPIWVAARDPGTYDWAVKNGCSIQSWAIARPFSEVELYKQHFESALKKAPDIARPRFMTMRHVAVYEKPDEWQLPVQCFIRQSALFENLFKNLGGVTNGFVDQIDLAAVSNRADYDAQTLRRNLPFGQPHEVIQTLRRYEALGVDYFCYFTTFGLPMKEQKKSLKLFIDEVMPAFRSKEASHKAAE